MYGPAGVIWKVRCQNSTRAHKLGENPRLDVVVVGVLAARSNGDGEQSAMVTGKSNKEEGSILMLWVG